MAGRLACSGERNVRNVEIGARPMEAGKDTLADFANFGSGAFGKEDDNLAEFLIRTFCN